MRLTVEPELGLLAAVNSARAEWTRAVQGELCIDEAVEEGLMLQDTRGRIHVRADPSGTQGNSVVSRYIQSSGVMLNAEINLVNAADPRELSFLVGLALGLTRSTDEERSIMSFPLTERTAPGPDDVASLQALYGPPAVWCR